MVNKKMGLRIVITLCAILFSLGLNAQNVVSVIPYEVYGGKMIVKIFVNGQEERFIFDTGAGKSSLSTEYCRANNLIAIDSIKINDVTSTTAYYPQTRIALMTTLDEKVRFNNVPVIIMPEPSPLRCFNVIGLIGSDLLATTICIIDPKTKTITITSSENPSQESLRYSHNLLPNNVLPIFSVLVNGIEISTLFDSGSYSFMNLKNSDFERLKEKDAVTVISQGSGAKSFGLANKIESDEGNRVYVQNLRVGPAKFEDIFTETSNTPYTLLGVRFLEYAKIVIDYPRRRLFYLPFEQDTIKPVFKHTNFGVTIRDGKLVVANTWGDLSNVISEGDLVTHINGVQTGTYDFCNIIAGVKELKGSDPKILTIKTKGGKVVDLEYKTEVSKL